MDLRIKQDIFQCLHDGTIDSILQAGEFLIISIDIQYLAEKVNPSYTHFNLWISGVTHLSYKSYDQEKSIFDYDQISSICPEILSIQDDSDHITIDCAEHLGVGGVFDLVCGDILIKDDNNDAVSVETFFKIQQEYWHDFDKR